MTDTSNHVVVQPDDLHAFVLTILQSKNTPMDVAADVADVLVGADVAGYQSHGVQLIEEYLHSLRTGAIVPNARPEIRISSPASVIVRGNQAWPHHVMRVGLKKSISVANRAGACLATFDGLGHIGRLGAYVEEAAKLHCIAILWTGSGLVPEDAVTAGYGGSERVLGTNPIAIAGPLADDHPFVFDASTSALSFNAVKSAYLQGKSLPEGVLLDNKGSPSNDPGAFFLGGSILPAAGHRGYGLGLANCVLGALCEQSVPTPGMTGTVLLVISVARISSFDRYTNRLAGFLKLLDRRVAGGVTSSIPGWRLAQRRQTNLAKGIDLPKSTCRLLASLSREYCIDVQGSLTLAINAGTD